METKEYKCEKCGSTEVVENYVEVVESQRKFYKGEEESWNTGYMFKKQLLSVICINCEHIMWNNPEGFEFKI